MGAGLNPVVVLATLIMQVTIGTVWYGPMFGRVVYGRSRVPESPLLPLLTTILCTGFLMVLANHLAIEFRVTTWQQGSSLAGVIWVIEACLNIRHYMFEQRPFSLFLVHSGYHLVTLVMTCSLVAAFGTR